jgi:hypothetical protein
MMLYQIEMKFLAQIRRVLTQFAKIETFSGHLEITGAGTDTKASFYEGLPFTRGRTNPPEPTQE